MLALLVLKIVLFLTAMPKITVDYVAEYNEIARPQNVNPDDNAAPYYQKAFDLFYEMPYELRKPYINWPTDFNDAEQALLEKWLISNAPAFEYFREALNKPYYWLERRAWQGNKMTGIMLPELSQLCKLTRALIWNAKLNAVKGQYQSAFENVLDCYRASHHKCRPRLLLMEQHVGLCIKQDVVESVLVILDKSEVESEALKFFQNALQTEVDNNAYVPSIQTEKYFLYDSLQLTFVDNGKGTGRLAWNVGWFYKLRSTWSNLKHRLRNCFAGPTRNEIVQQTEKVLAISNQVMPQTPWQVRNEGYSYFREIDNINNSNFFLQIFGINPKGAFRLYHETRAQTEALITVLAILRFKADNHRFPEILDELVSTGYLEFIPVDPYNGRPLAYKPAEDKFQLYSVGVDFSDAGGVIYWPTQW